MATMAGNDDKVVGSAKEVGGKVQQAVGDLTDDKELKAKGEVNEKKGKAQNLAGKIKDGVADAVDNVKDVVDDVLNKDKNKDKI